MQLQSPQAPPLKYLLAELINSLVERANHFLLILDDYHVIKEEQVHATLAYLIEYLPPQLRLVVATRADPPLPLARLRVRHQVLEVRTDQLRCTSEETRAFFQEVIGIGLADEMIERVTARTEGWLVGLQLIRLSLTEQANLATLLEEASGDQRYILDYLTEVVLLRQPSEVQTFLLSTCILEQLNGPLCDAVMEQIGSQQMLQRLEQANLFVSSLDSKRQWYRYHALFAEALRYRLEQTRSDLIPILHHRASLWYAEHNQITLAVLHALRAHQWQWAAELIESHPLLSLTWGASKHELIMFRAWLEQLPVDIVHSRPRLCMDCVILLWAAAPYAMIKVWLDAAEARLTALLTMQKPSDALPTMLTSEVQQHLEDLLGETLVHRAWQKSIQGHGEDVLLLCQRALSLLSADNDMIRSLVCQTQAVAYYSSVNNVEAAIKSGVQAVSLAQAARQSILAMAYTSQIALCLIAAGRLHEAERLSLQAIESGKQPEEEIMWSSVGWTALFQADVLREWNKLTDARTVAEEAISLCKQIESIHTLAFLFFGYAMLLRVCLSCGEREEAHLILHQINGVSTSMNQHTSLYMRSLFTMVDQIKLWLACGELDRAASWVEELDSREQYSSPFIHERKEVARVRVLLAKRQPDLALKHLEPVLRRATAGKRWGHVIEIRLLQALAYRMCDEGTKALSTFAEAVRLGEPEGYIRSFVDEGASIEALLYQLRKRERKKGPTLYLDTLLAAFQQESKTHVSAEEPTKAYQLPEPLSERELEVLQLLTRGASNQEIAQELVIVVDTVKRHVSHIFSKLGVQNRVQAVRQARELGLLDEEY
jgi:LuxR family maltose regulon positive regulatory protein